MLSESLGLLKEKCNKTLYVEVKNVVKRWRNELMKNKKWNRFNKLTEKCYLNMIGAEEDNSCWEQAFELLMEIVQEERAQDARFASELEMLDDATDYEYVIQGWVEDCLDEIEMREEHKTLLYMCDKLLDMFGWPEYTGTDIRFRKAAAMSRLGQKKEAAEFCNKWLKKEPENMIAACAGVYAYIEIKDFTEAEKLVEYFIPDKSRCSEENDMMFMAAATLYQVTGRKKEKKVVEKAMKEYEEFLEEYFGCPELDEEFLDEELPF